MRWRGLGLSGILFFLASLSGCTTFPPAPYPTANWQTRIGQARYMDAQRAVTGDVSLRIAPAMPDTYALEFSKAGNRLLLLTRQGEIGWASGLLAKGNFAGPVATAPVHLRPWFDNTSRTVQKKTLVNPDSLPRVEFRLQP